MATVTETTHITNVADEVPVQVVHIIDHTAHRYEGDCEFPGKWTWHTQRNGHFDTTNPIEGFEREGATVYSIRGASVPAFTWQKFRCVPDETTRYRRSLT